MMTTMLLVMMMTMLMTSIITMMTMEFRASGLGFWSGMGLCVGEP